MKFSHVSVILFGTLAMSVSHTAPLANVGTLALAEAEANAGFWVFQN